MNFDNLSIADCSLEHFAESVHKFFPFFLDQTVFAFAVIKLFKQLKFLLFGRRCDFSFTGDEVQNVTKICITQLVLVHVSSTGLLLVVDGSFLDNRPEPLNVLG
jgi:hypothetical protein